MQKLVAMCQGGTLNDRATVMRILMDGGLAPAATRTECAARAKAGTQARAQAGCSARRGSGCVRRRHRFRRPRGSCLTPGQPLTELKRALGVPGDANLDGVRVVELALVPTQFVVKLEPWACQYWKDIAPDSRTEVPPTVARTLGKFAMGGDDKANKDLAGDVPAAEPGEPADEGRS